MTWAALDPPRRQLVEQALTEQQLRIFKYRLDRHSYRTIAEAMHLHESTVRYHCRRIADILETELAKEAA